MDEEQGNSSALENTKRGLNYANKGRKTYSRATKIKALIAALTAVVVVGLALGLGLGLGLKSGGDDNDHNND